ncbi:hypothetical protein M501DRAFT_513474 [Patellaria atrata CBS 101060]|uniref:Uncharacterized protein n=1 Tax=Patellaria atrata CBS 101060 TaxID=1346257 RepID=A0A9P4S1V6_9PEZI|nr:hypothetical protein M501DRAFT_513474 [Patellaria atrata CBS 101060]
MASDPETASVAPSEATTLVDANSRHDPISNILPPATPISQLNDDSIMSVAIPLSHLEAPAPAQDLSSPIVNEKKSLSGIISKLAKPLRSSSSTSSKDDLRIIRMTKKEYLQYWATDGEGNYIGSEPDEEVGKEIWREKIRKGEVKALTPMEARGNGWTLGAMVGAGFSGGGA